jgi:preprotein translocase subunit SecB
MSAKNPYVSSPLELSFHYIKELSFSVTESYIDKNLSNLQVGSPQIAVEVKTEKIDDSLRDWRIEVLIETEKETASDFPYSFRTVLVGFFHVGDEWPDNRVETLTKINGTSLLFSAAREALVTMTSRTGFPATVLPVVMFTPLAQQAQESHAAPVAESATAGLVIDEKSEAPIAKRPTKKKGSSKIKE